MNETGNRSRSFSNIINIYISQTSTIEKYSNVDSFLYNVPISFLRSRYYVHSDGKGGGVVREGDFGRYRSSYGSTTGYASNFNFEPDNIRANSGEARGLGMSLRCLAR